MVLDSRSEVFRMLRISKLTDYATVILAYLSRGGSECHSAPEVAAATGIATPTVSKLLKELQKYGLVRSTRGAKGGYALARPATEISAAEIIDAVEGPVSLTECTHHPGQCELEGSCAVGSTWQRVSLAIRAALEELKLSQLSGRDGRPVPVPKLHGMAESPIVWRGRS
jgi:FeS assembly SUF system regulator